MCEESTMMVVLFAPIFLIVPWCCAMSGTTCDCVRKTTWESDQFPVVEIRHMPGVPRYMLVSDAGSPEVDGHYIRL
jgi:hypothetical protein